MASLRVRLPDETGRTSAPSNFSPEDIEFLALDVHFAHVDHTLKPQHRADRGGGDPVLPRACFRDNALLAHAPVPARPARARY